MANEIILENPKDKFQNIATIGNFDGLHIAHQMLIRSVYLNTTKFGTGKSMVISFEPHPKALYGEAPKLLLDKKTKREFIEDILHCDEYIELEFNQELANMTPEEFVKKILAERFKLDVVIVGFNFTFGKNASGNAEMLAELCEKEGIKVVISPEVTNYLGIISSSLIREKLYEGDLEAVNKSLRYWYNFRGEVIKCKQNGRKLGFPTANILIPEDRALPPYGVYAVRAVVDGKTYTGIANLGVKPTVTDENKLMLETHLFNYIDLRGDLYGKEIQVFLHDFMRPEQKFASIDELRKTVKENINEARMKMSYVKGNKHLPIEN